jgi:hypothetical protein
LLHDLYHQLYQDKKKINVDNKIIETIESLFSYLDNDGNIHLRLSQLFMLHLAAMLQENTHIPASYELFKPYFKNKNK